MSQGLISSWKDKGSALEGPMEDRNERQSTSTDTFERHTEEQKRRETTTKEEFKKKSTSSYTLYILFLHFVLICRDWGVSNIFIGWDWHIWWGSLDLCPPYQGLFPLIAWIQTVYCWFQDTSFQCTRIHRLLVVFQRQNDISTGFVDSLRFYFMWSGELLLGHFQWNSKLYMEWQQSASLRQMCSVESFGIKSSIMGGLFL